MTKVTPEPPDPPFCGYYHMDPEHTKVGAGELKAIERTALQFRDRYGELPFAPWESVVQSIGEALGSFECGADLRNALKPFADAADDLRDETRDDSNIWELPAAMSITVGDLRTAADLLARPATPIADTAIDEGAREALANEVRAIAEDSDYSNEMVGIAVRNWFHRQAVRAALQSKGQS